MKNKKYLVIGDAGSMHIYNFVKTVLLPREYEVHLLTLSVEPVRELYRNYYLENGVILHSVAEKGYKDLHKKDKFHRVLHLLRKLRLMNEVPYVDICHIQSVYKTSLEMVRLFRKKYGKLILSYWGGDVEDRSEYVVNLRRKCFGFADAITVTVERTREQFEEIYGKEFSHKLYVCRFATNGLDCIKEIAEKNTLENCRQAYGIPNGKICITCGYSAYEEQHQDKCLEMINGLDGGIKQKLFVIVPMQYGRYNQPYIDRVEETAKKCDFEVKILTEFVPFEMSAKLAIATDIYLHVRDTDAFSNALKEHVFAGSTVIKGDWLIYRELERMKADICSIPDLDALPDMLLKTVENYSPADGIKLFEPIYDLYSTENIVKQWGKVIDGLNAVNDCE